MSENIFIWSSAAITDVGGGRNNNQDAVLDLPERGLWAVADGMGGHSRGEYASQRVIKNLNTLNTSTAEAKKRIEDIHKVLLKTNLELIEFAKHEQVDMVGSTATVLMIQDSWAACVWLGDSRLYLVRDKKIQQITKDHSLVEDWIAQGLITQAQAEQHKAKNVITSCLGANTTPKIDFKLLGLQSEDILLLCTDGLYSVMSEAAMLKLLVENHPKIATTKLLVTALNNGTTDNLSAVIVKIKRNKAHQLPSSLNRY